jgi:hypothetical protein
MRVQRNWDFESHDTTLLLGSLAIPFLYADLAGHCSPWLSANF